MIYSEIGNFKKENQLALSLVTFLFSLLKEVASASQRYKRNSKEELHIKK